MKTNYQFCWKTGKEEEISVCELRIKSVRKSIRRGNIPEYSFCGNCGLSKDKQPTLSYEKIDQKFSLICKKCDKVFKAVYSGTKYCLKCQVRKVKR